MKLAFVILPITFGRIFLAFHFLGGGGKYKYKHAPPPHLYEIEAT